MTALTRQCATRAQFREVLEFVCWTCPYLHYLPLLGPLHSILERLLSMHIYMYTHPRTHAHTLTDTDTDRQTDTQTQTHTHTHTHTHNIYI